MFTGSSPLPWHIQVIVVTHSHTEPNNLKTCRIGIRQLSWGITVYHLPLATLVSEATLPNFFTSQPLLRYIFIRERIDIVHAHASLSSLAHEALFHARATCATGGQRRHHIKTVFTDHSLFSLGEDSASALTNKLLGFVLSDVDRVVTVSYTGKENTCLRAQFNPEKVFVIPNAVDSTVFCRRPSSQAEGDIESDRTSNRITIVALSRLTYRKGISLLLEAVPLICEWCPDVDFLIGGDGPKRVDLELMRERSRLFLLDRVTLVGQVSGADAVRRHLSSGDIFVSPSLTEAFGTTLIEAASCGLLCVATRVGGVPETLPSPSVLMLSEPSADDLVKVLKEAVERIRRKQQNSIRSAASEDEARSVTSEPDRLSSATFRQTYSWSQVARRLESVYQGALQEPNPSTAQRMQRYLNGADLPSAARSGRGFVSGLVFCIVVATNLAFAAILEWSWPADDIEKAIWWLADPSKSVTKSI